jgi:hypothetical protein
VQSASDDTPEEISAKRLDLQSWRDLYEERTAAWRLGRARDRDKAARLAWGELQNRWHMRYGERVPPHLCAGCRRPVGQGPALDLIDGCRVHLAEGYDCLIRWGERWRGRSTAVLRALGLDPPSGLGRF